MPGDCPALHARSGVFLWSSCPGFAGPTSFLPRPLPDSVAHIPLVVLGTWPFLLSANGARGVRVSLLAPLCQGPLGFLLHWFSFHAGGGFRSTFPPGRRLLSSGTCLAPPLCRLLAGLCVLLHGFLLRFFRDFVLRRLCLFVVSLCGLSPYCRFYWCLLRRPSALAVTGFLIRGIVHESCCLSFLRNGVHDQVGVALPFHPSLLLGPLSGGFSGRP